MTAMSQAAWRLHLENVELQAAAKDLRRQLRAATTKTTRCVYCGALTWRKTRTCHGHSDLPALDAGYHGPV